MASAKRRRTDGDDRAPASAKTVLVIRHGEAQHNLKGKKTRRMFDPLLGPALTELGNQQAHAAAVAVADVVAEDDSCDSPLVITSNLLRAVETALHAVPDADVIEIHPLLRERLSDTCDEPSDLDALQEWIAKLPPGVPCLCTTAYEEAVAAAGGKTEYKKECWSADCIGSKTNREGLRKRSQQLTAWVEAQPASTIVLVGHSMFLAQLTGDSRYLENGEVRKYSLTGGAWTSQGTVGGASTISPASFAASMSPSLFSTAPHAAITPASAAARTAMAPMSAAARASITPASAAYRARASITPAAASARGSITPAAASARGSITPAACLLRPRGSVAAVSAAAGWS